MHCQFLEILRNLLDSCTLSGPQVHVSAIFWNMSIFTLFVTCFFPFLFFFIFASLHSPLWILRSFWSCCFVKLNIGRLNEMHFVKVLLKSYKLKCGLNYNILFFDNISHESWKIWPCTLYIHLYEFLVSCLQEFMMLECLAMFIEL